MDDNRKSDGQGERKTALMESPWFKEAYNSALKFYEKDSALDSKDRLELSRTFVSIARAELWGGWAAFALVFGAPFGYRLYKTGAVRGVKVPRNFVLGLFAMFTTTQACGRYAFNSKLAQLQNDGNFTPRGSFGDDDDQSRPETNQQRQYEMMKLVGYGMAPKWGNYFYTTFHNPEKRLPNPKVKLQEMKEGKTSNISPILNQRDPLGLYTGPGSEKKRGIPQGNGEQSGATSSTSDKDGVETGTTTGSSWDRLRQENGITTKSPGGRWSQIRKAPSDGSDIFGSSQPSQSSQFSEQPTDDSQGAEGAQEDFDALFEKERRGEDTV